MLNSKSEISYEIVTDGKEGEIYIYSLVEEAPERQRFGVQVVMKSDAALYRAESGTIFSNRKRACDFLVFLARHLVTPANLPYIIEDALDFE